MPKPQSRIKIKTQPKAKPKESQAKKEARQAAERRKKQKAKPTRKKAQVFNVKLSPLNPKKPKQLPVTPQIIRGLPLRKMLRGTPRLMINNSAEVDILELGKVKTRAGSPGIKAKCLTRDPFRPNKTQRVREVFIIGIEKDKDDNFVDKPVNAHKKVLVSCSCESFVFTFEYANAAHGASRLVYGNGEPPVVTNPQLQYGLCKHLVKVAQHIIKKDL